MKKLLVFTALLVFLAGTAASAAEWNFYGSARVNTFRTDWKVDMLRGASKNPYLGTGGDTKNFEESLYGNARIGANVKVSDELTGRFEYGALGGTANIRILWGEWNFGSGSLGIGKNYTPLLMPYSNQVYGIHALGKGDHNMSTFGMLYGQREAMIRLKFGGLQIAAVEPRQFVFHERNSMLVGLAGGSKAAPDTKGDLPGIQAKYKYDFDWGHLAVAGGYHTFQVVRNNIEYDVDSYVLAAGGRVNVGPVYFKANIWGGQNVGNLVDILVNGALWSSTTNVNSSNFDGAGWGFAQWNDGAAGGTVGITDNEAMAGLLVAGLEIRKGLYMEAGYGYTKTELDGAAYDKDDAVTYYLQATIFLAPGVFITPEIGRCDMRQTGQPDVKYFGAKWQINF